MTTLLASVVMVASAALCLVRACRGRRALPIAATAVIALAYPAAAWLSLAHGHSAGAARTEPGASAPGSAAPQSHVHGAGDLLALLPGIAVLALIAALLTVSVRAARRRRAGVATEGLAMSGMLAAMLL